MRFTVHPCVYNRDLVERKQNFSNIIIFINLEGHSHNKSCAHITPTCLFILRLVWIWWMTTLQQPKDEEEGKTFYFHLSSFSCFMHSHFYVFDPWNIGLYQYMSSTLCFYDQSLFSSYPPHPFGCGFLCAAEVPLFAMAMKKRELNRLRIWVAMFNISLG